MNLRLCKGKIPIFRRWEQGSEYFLIDFPSREVFFSLYSHQVSDQNKAKYYEIIKHRASGKTRRECGNLVGLSQGAVAKIEFKFLRLMRQWYVDDFERNLYKITLSHEALLAFLKTEMPESSPHVDDNH
jgi:hypothetical protein